MGRYQRYSRSPKVRSFAVDNQIHTIVVSSGKLTYCQKPGNVYELLDIVVPEEDRRKGIGTELVQELRKAVDGPIHVFTRRSNGVARCFYQSLGMFPIVIPGYYTEEDGVLYVDKLRP